MLWLFLNYIKKYGQRPFIFSYGVFLLVILLIWIQVNSLDIKRVQCKSTTTAKGGGS